MRKALATLPGVEQDSIIVSKDESKASFHVSDPQQFKVSDALDKVKEAGYTPSLAKAGKAVQK